MAVHVSYSRAPARAAARIRPANSLGWEAGDAWLERTSMVLAPIRAAMKRSRSGLIIRSRVETRNHDGTVLHAGGPAGSAKHLAAIGFAPRPELAPDAPGCPGRSWPGWPPDRTTGTRVSPVARGPGPAAAGTGR